MSAKMLLIEKTFFGGGGRIDDEKATWVAFFLSLFPRLHHSLFILLDV